MMGEQLGTGKTPQTFPEELPPLQEENSEITNLNNDTECWNQEGGRGIWSIFRARGKRQVWGLGGEKQEESARGATAHSLPWGNSRVSRKQTSTGKPPGTPENLPDTTATSPKPQKTSQTPLSSNKPARY